jgi:hypothetical protein
MTSRQKHLSFAAWSLTAGGMFLAVPRCFTFWRRPTSRRSCGKLLTLRRSRF